MTFDPATHVHTVKEVSSIRACMRSWAAKYLHGLPDPKHPNAQDGIDMHQILAAMVRNGPAANVHPESKVGARARALWPLAPPGCFAEVSTTFQYAGRTLSFALDWAVQGFTAFGDWKSTAGPQWVLAGPGATPAEQQAALAGDLQANLEAHGVCVTFGHAAVALRWCYVDKKTNQTWTVDGTLTRDGTREWLGANALPHIEMIEALRGCATPPPVQQIPLDITACHRGHGKVSCSFLGACAFRPAPLTTQDMYTELRKP